MIRSVALLVLVSTVGFIEADSLGETEVDERLLQALASAMRTVILSRISNHKHRFEGKAVPQGPERCSRQLLQLAAAVSSRSSCKCKAIQIWRK